MKIEYAHSRTEYRVVYFAHSRMAWRNAAEKGVCSVTMHRPPTSEFLAAIAVDCGTDTPADVRVEERTVSVTAWETAGADD